MKKEKEKAKEKVLDQYELSEYDSDFSESDEDEDARGKFIPDWARKKNPSKSIMRQKCIDPDTIFGKILLKTVDLAEIFQDYPSRTKYRQRSASGDWSKDLTHGQKSVHIKKIWAGF